MQFSSFSRHEENNIIILANEVPVENVKSIQYYSDNSKGTFAKKEFRWSFNNAHWSAWQTLTQKDISFINTHGNYYFFLQVRYVLSAASSGSVTRFTLNYTAEDATITPRIIHQDIEIPDSSAVIIHDIIQSYDIVKIVDACTLNGYSGSWYLNRKNQNGIQPISSVAGLQAILDQLMSNSGVSFTYVDGSLLSRDISINYLVNNYLPQSSLGYTFYWDTSGYLEASGTGGSTINASLSNYVIPRWDASNHALIDTSIFFKNGYTGINITNPQYTLDVSGNLNIAGDLTATTKSFLIDHPTIPGKKLQYGNIEGPEFGVYIRGKYDSNIIELPDYWKKLVDEKTITVNLTSLNKLNIPFIKKICNEYVQIGKLGFGKLRGHYIIFAERKDVSKLIIEK